MKPIQKCQDADPNCPVCKGDCENDADIILFRIDMQDETGTAFCVACAKDAMEFGLFRSDK